MSFGDALLAHLQSSQTPACHLCMAYPDCAQESCLLSSTTSCGTTTTAMHWSHANHAAVTASPSVDPTCLTSHHSYDCSCMASAQLKEYHRGPIAPGMTLKLFFSFCNPLHSSLLI